MEFTAWTSDLTEDYIKINAGLQVLSKRLIALLALVNEKNEVLISLRKNKRI